MEVHHPHHPTHKKNWKEYIVEFLMLFAAVTLGFFAENIREHQIIDNHKNQNLIAMVNDLQQDSIEIKKRISEYSKAVKQFEKIKDLSLAYHQKQITENELIDAVVSEYLNTKWSISLFINNASYKNTISAGSLGYIQNNETKQLIAQYYEVLYGKLLVNNTILDNDASEFTGKTFIFGYMQKSNEKLEGQTRTNDEQIEDF
ncbi:MAG: hypothetical protein FJ348_01510 [Sphingomonadales bacterium]|nr:hypothetical protein [Sphingomonadales bacterium]